MRSQSLLAIASLTISAAGAAGAQASARVDAEVDARRLRNLAVELMQEDRDRPRLGLSTGSTGKRDTLGLLVTSVTRDGPADKAGIEEGDRIAQINSVNLRLAPGDAGEPDMEGVALRRMTRELAKHKAGDEVELRVHRDGQLRTMRVKTVAAEDLTGAFSVSRRREELDDRAVIGIGLGGTGSKRDTLGVFVTGVTSNGPAEQAGIVEGDRLQSINGVDLRVPAEDAGDWGASSARVRRLQRALGDVKAGDEVTIRVYSGGRTRDVRVKTMRSEDLREESHGSFFMSDGPMGFGGFRFEVPRGRYFDGGPVIVSPRMAPGGTRFYYHDGRSGGVLRPGVELKVAPRISHELEMQRKIEEDVKQKVEKAVRKSVVRSISVSI
jgi:predicted metalloprotease with PDZ domain